MTKTRVVNLRREPYDVYIGRPGPFGNPFVLTGEENRAEVLARFKEWFEKKVRDDTVYRERVEALRGKTLGCFCKPKACHGDVIVAWLEKEEK